MTGKQAKQPKSRWQFAIGVTLAALLCSVSAWVVFKRFTVTAIAPPFDALPSSVSEVAPKAIEKQPTSESTATKTPAAPLTRQAGTSANVQVAGIPAIRQGAFRIGNPTNYPVRVALLSQKTPLETVRTKEQSSQSGKASQQNYELPAHWDFAPEEGGTQGLLVSLPDRALKLKKGDVLVAFAQDGSGRYWGPYVVDKTALPLWNAKAVEWQLILQP